MRCASGVRLYYEVHGDGPTTVLLLPTWSIVHSRIWKLQVPYLARHARVVVFDGRGNGRSDRPAGPSAYDDAELVADALAVLDAVGVQEAVVVGLSAGARVLLVLAADHPDRVRGAVFAGSDIVLEDRPNPIEDAFERERDSYDGWGQWNAHHWRRDQAGFVEFFFGEAFPERALDQAGGGRGGVGARDRRGDAGLDPLTHGAGSFAPPRHWPRPRRCAVRPS